MAFLIFGFTFVALQGLIRLRAITLTSGNFCKIEKGSIFTHFGPKKHPHQWVQNCAFMHNCYSNRAYIHGYCSTCINILVISLSLSLCCSHLTLPLASLSMINITTAARRTPSINITPLPPISIKPHSAWSNRCWSLSPQSPFFSFDQGSNHCRRWTRWSRSNHYRRSTSNHCHTKPD